MAFKKWTLDQVREAYNIEWPKFSADTLAIFAYENWRKITGQPTRTRDYEQHFPYEITELCESYGISEFNDEFMYSFSAK